MASRPGASRQVSSPFEALGHVGAIRRVPAGSPRWGQPDHIRPVRRPRALDGAAPRASAETLHGDVYLSGAIRLLTPYRRLRGPQDDTDRRTRPNRIEDDLTCRSRRLICSTPPRRPEAPWRWP